ncbi:cell division control protein 6 homolog B-like [Nymphaea colorata]|nr:cell division control protein 6 homolog B-like [Nymphaea colorata]XP_031488457.1 cell division control protein 6 homolog B-like [Nymphaea colorata]XP_049934125.1 cell division control protein 6 homolog B-like [Nymphaea colorata]
MARQSKGIGSPASTPRSGRKSQINSPSSSTAADGTGPDSGLQSTPTRKRGRPHSTPENPSTRQRFASPKSTTCQTPVSCSGGRRNGRPGTPTKVCCKIKSPRKRLVDVLDQKPKWNPRDCSHLNAVKEALHVSTVPADLTCREEEQEQVLGFCKRCIQQEKSGSLYVSGSPGTGKSLVMEKVKCLAADWAKEAGLQLELLSINCTSVSDSSEIFRRIRDKYAGKKKQGSSGSPLKHLHNLLSIPKRSSVRKMMLLIVDEIDFLLTKDRSVLHDLFMITTLPLSRCVLIGIANSIDLADRFLPKLHSLNCKPLVITFRAYSKDQILKILQKRISAFPYYVFQPHALEICARKVAAVSGDIRKALDSCRLAVETLEAELHSATNLTVVSSQMTSTAQHMPLSIEGLPSHESDLVRIDHMANALSKTFKSAVVNTIQSLPLHQQMILCSAVKSSSIKRNISEPELYKSYSELARSKKMSPASILEFASISGLLAEQGLIKFGKSRNDKFKMLTLQVDTTDVIFALQGNPLFSDCLQSDH